MKNKDDIYGFLASLAAYAMWGVLPVYWKLIKQVSAFEIITHRIIWSCLFLFALMAIRGTLKNFKRVTWDFKTIVGVILSAALITANWTTYVWAVNFNHILDTSLGYYINPIFAVLLGAIFLKERIGWEGIFVLVLATIGVGIQIFELNQFPWVAIVLAVSFGCYSLLKKTLPVDAETGLFLETAISTPFAFIYLFYLNSGHGGSTLSASPLEFALLAGTGVVTAVPLLLFGIGARKIDLSIVGLMQYLTPTATLLIGLFVYDEPMPMKRLVTFILIWIGLIVFTVVRIKRRSKPKLVEEF